jgi:hypothetical protein
MKKDDDEVFSFKGLSPFGPPSYDLSQKSEEDDSGGSGFVSDAQRRAFFGTHPEAAHGGGISAEKIGARVVSSAISGSKEEKFLNSNDSMYGRKPGSTIAGLHAATDSAHEKLLAVAKTHPELTGGKLRDASDYIVAHEMGTNGNFITQNQRNYISREVATSVAKKLGRSAEY